MSFWNDFDDKKPAADRDGEFFAQAADTGVAVLIGAEIFKGNDDPHTYKLLFKIKESKTGANEVDSNRVVIKKLDTGKFDFSFARTQIAKMTGTDANNKEESRKVFEKVFRLDEERRSKPNTMSPLAGMEFRYSVAPSKTKAGDIQYHPSFAPVKFDTEELKKDTVRANRKTYGLETAAAQ